MSSIRKVSFSEAVKKQFAYKLKAYHGMFGAMIIFQLIALFFSFRGEFASTSHNNLTITTNVYAADIIVTFSLLWAFTMAIYLTNKASKNMMFTFVTDKQTNHIANLLFIIFFSVVGGVTATLLGYVVRLFIIIYYGTERILFFDPITITGLLISIVTAILYHLLVAIIGYTIGELVQLHRSLMFIIPIILFGFFATGINLMEEPYFINFFIFETSFSLFTLKVIVTSVILFSIATQVGRGLEVRRP